MPKYINQNIVINYTKETTDFKGFIVKPKAFYGIYNGMPFVSDGHRDKYGRVEIYGFFKKKKQANAKWQEYDGCGHLALIISKQREIEDANEGRRSEYHSMSYIPQKKHSLVF